MHAVECVHVDDDEIQTVHYDELITKPGNGQRYRRV